MIAIMIFVVVAILIHKVVNNQFKLMSTEMGKIETKRITSTDSSAKAVVTLRF